VSYKAYRPCLTIALHLSRVHGAFVSDDEIENVVGFLREHSQTNYLNSVGARVNF
jgi:DNA segregation ATPase FtsK/SpoIIIE-like protein